MIDSLQYQPICKDTVPVLSAFLILIFFCKHEHTTFIFLAVKIQFMDLCASHWQTNILPIGIELA